MDTTKDLRILLAEDAITRLERIIANKRLPYQYSRELVLEAIREIRANILSLKYSYMDAQFLIQNPALNTIEANIALIWSHLKPPESMSKSDIKAKLAISELKYAIRIIHGLRKRFGLGNENKPEFAIDIIAMRIENIFSHPKADNLKVAVVSDTKQSFIVLTNIETIKKNWIMAVAFLPPIVLYDIISEGMFCSSNLSNNELIGKRVPPELINRSEIANKVVGILRG